MVKDQFTKQLWIGLGIVIVSIAIAGGATFFLFDTISSQADAIVNDRLSMQEKTSAVAKLAEFKAEDVQAEQYQRAINQLLPDQYGLVTFTQWLSQLGFKYGVTTSAAFLGSVVPPAGGVAGTAQFSFSAEGSSGDVVAFLYGMNAKAPGFLVSLTSFTVASDGAVEKVTGQGMLFFR
jgi:hypothetical protein